MIGEGRIVEGRDDDPSSVRALSAVPKVVISQREDVGLPQHVVVDGGCASVGVVVITYNAGRVIGACLASLLSQTVQPEKIVVVDCGRTDSTRDILSRFPNVSVVASEKGFARQRNAGAKHISSKYILFVDADMVLDPYLIEEALTLAAAGFESLVIPERFVGSGYWGRVRAFERRFYDGINCIEGARWHTRSAYVSVGGYDDALELGEEWDIDERMRNHYCVGRTLRGILCDEGGPSLQSLLRKKAYYTLHSDGFRHFRAKHPSRAAQILSPSFRLWLFARHPLWLLLHPALAAGVMVLGAGELAIVRSVRVRLHFASDPWRGPEKALG